MTIDEAITILEGWVELEDTPEWENQMKARKLGIEALKREQVNRKYGRGYPGNRLLGETEEREE